MTHTMPYELPQLPYAYDALEPHIDAQTMEIHHTKHHNGYITKLNATLEKYPDLAEQSVEELLQQFDSLQMDEADKTSLRNNGGGAVNHSFFWQIMGPDKQVDEQLVAEIKKTFGSVDTFKEQFVAAAAGRFGSGWAWLARDAQGQLTVYINPNHDSPYLLVHQPVIGLVFGEHAYYLKYQNKRPDYIDAWWQVCTLLP